MKFLLFLLLLSSCKADESSTDVVYIRVACSSIENSCMSFNNYSFDVICKMHSGESMFLYSGQVYHYSFNQSDYPMVCKK
jgi:hypothetical protein